MYVRKVYTYARNTSALVKLCESGSLLDLRAYIETLKLNDWGQFVLTRLANARGFITPTVPLIVCVKQGNYPMALELLTTIPRINVDAKDSEGRTALYYAVTSSRRDLVLLLLKHYADKNHPLPSSHGREPVLITACRLGLTEMVQVLVENGANVDVSRRKDGATPLIEAARFGRSSVVFLLSKSNSVDGSSTQGIQALQVATAHGREGVIQELSELIKVPPQDRNVEVSTLVEGGEVTEAAAQSVRPKSANRVRVRVTGSWLPTPFWNRLSVLEAAVFAGNLSDLRALKEAEAEAGDGVVSKQTWAKGALLAVETNDAAAFDLLLDEVIDAFGGDRESMEVFWNEAFTVGISLGFHGMVVDTLTKGYEDNSTPEQCNNMWQYVVDLCVRCNRPHTFSAMFKLIPFDPHIHNELVEVCATSGSKEMMDMLMDSRGSSFNQVILSRALAEAQRRGFERCAMALWQQDSASKAFLPSDIAIAVDAARIGAYPLLAHASKFGLVALLKGYLGLPGIDVNLAHAATLRTPLTLCTTVQGAELLIKDGRTELNSTDVDGNCPMQLLLQAPFPRRVMGLAWGETNPFEGLTLAERRKVLDLLIAQQRFDVNQVSSDGVSPAWHRCREIDLLSTLLACSKLDINARGLGGRTFLYSCVLEQRLGLKWFTAVMTRKDVDVNIGDEAGWNPICLACRYAHEEILVRLLGHPDIDVNWKKTDGWTPFMLAAANGSHRIVNLLLNVQGKKLDLQMKNDNGKTALDLAVEFKKPDVAELLRRQGRQSRKRVLI